MQTVAAIIGLTIFSVAIGFAIYGLIHKGSDFISRYKI